MNGVHDTKRQSFSRVFYLIVLLALICTVACQSELDNGKGNDFALGETDYLIDCDPAGQSASALACQLGFFTNRQRLAHPEESDQADPLDWSEDLADVALNYSERICDEGFFDHVDPSGNKMEIRLQSAGIFYVKAGENLARGTDMLPSQAMTLFMDELSCEKNHRGNILDNDFTHMGVGTVFCGKKTIYTQLFATYDEQDLRNDQNEFCS